VTTFVLVHGAWHGGWCWRRVASLLRQAGHEVFTPTLTGLGERAHLLTPEVGLDTHIRDVAAVLRYEALEDVVLVGHSYAGAVVTGVADVAGERLSRLVYVEGFIPADGECVFDHFPDQFRDLFRSLSQEHGEGWRIPATPRLLDVWGITDQADREWVGSNITDFPLRCFEQPLRLPNGGADHLPRAYVACTAYETAKTVTAPTAARARQAGWRCSELPSGHDPMVSHPREFAEILLAGSSDGVDDRSITRAW